jgi:hypothetical protein
VPASATITVYSELWIAATQEDTVQLTAYGYAEDTECWGITVEAYLLAPGGGQLAYNSNSAGCGVETQASVNLSWSSWTDGDYKSVAVASGPAGHHGCDERKESL